MTSITTTDADFVVKLIDVIPDSLSYNDINIYTDKDPDFKYPMGGYEMLVHGDFFCFFDNFNSFNYIFILVFVVYLAVVHF